MVLDDRQRFNFGNDLKRSNIYDVSAFPRCQNVSLLSKETLSHDLISYLKLKRFSSYIGIALLTITGGLDMALDLNYSLGCLVDDLWASELTVPNISPADG
ncbi:hypothetical protein Tco_0978388 [Tanacetum coccineum]|uniref:Uncharacterized protein n=1 Tax=Tanacetum coccineum TaxID=301880 RepID=A0ABQ5EMT4_9ASTR